jgi:hypothetical protein
MKDILNLFCPKRLEKNSCRRLGHAGLSSNCDDYFAQLLGVFDMFAIGVEG